MSGCHEVISCNTHVSNFHAAALYCTYMITGQNREMSAGFFERPGISVVFPVDDRNGCRY